MMPKSKLHEIVQEEYGKLPTYIFARDGPDNAPQFRAFISFCGLTFESPGPFRTLREAENAAADVALDALLAKPDNEPMQTDEPAVASFLVVLLFRLPTDPITLEPGVVEEIHERGKGLINNQTFETIVQIQSGEVHSNLQKEANKEETIQPPGSLPSTSESGITNVLSTSGQKEQRTAQLPQAHPQSFPSSRIHFVSLRELSTSENSGRGTNKQNIGNINSVSGNSGNEKNKEQGNNIATGTLGKRQRTEDLPQPEERTSIPQLCPGIYKSQLHEVAVTGGFRFPTYSCMRDGLPHRPRFKATVQFDGQTFESPGFFNTLRQAEHAAALAVLNSFSERDTLVESPMCKILLEIKAQKEGSPLPVYNTTSSYKSRRPVYTSTVKFNGMEFEGKAANRKKQAENNAATVAWSALKEFKGSAVSTLQVLNNKGKAPVCESNDHPLIQAINHLKEESTRAESNVSGFNLPKAKRLAFQEQVNKVTVEVERLRELITSISSGSCTFRGIPQNTDQARVQQEENMQNVVVDNSRWGIPDVRDLQNTDQARVQQEENMQNVVVENSRWGIPDVRDLQTNGWGDCGNFDNRGQQTTGSQANPNTNHSSARACTTHSRGRQQFRGRTRGRSGGRFSGRSSWASPPTNDNQLQALQLAISPNQSRVQQERNAQNVAPDVGSGWDVAGIDVGSGWNVAGRAVTGWDGWGNPEDIHQPQVGPQTTTRRDYSSARASGSHSRSRPRFPSHSTGRYGRSPPRTRHTEWTPPTRNDKQFPRLELAISPVREENVQNEEVNDGWNLPDFSDPPATGSGGWKNFDDRDPPPTTGMVAPCA